MYEREYFERKAYLVRGLKWLNELGVTWRITSFVRNSENHKTMNALDVAPFEKLPHFYSVTRMRDPLLPNRMALMHELLNQSVSAPAGLIFFVETDHIHIQRTKRSDVIPVIARWPVPKDACYVGASLDANHPESRGRGPEISNNQEADSIWAPFTGRFITEQGIVKQLNAQQMLGLIKKD